MPGAAGSDATAAAAAAATVARLESAELAVAGGRGGVRGDGDGRRGGLGTETWLRAAQALLSSLLRRARDDARRERARADASDKAAADLRLEALCLVATQQRAWRDRAAELARGRAEAVADARRLAAEWRARAEAQARAARAAAASVAPVVARDAEARARAASATAVACQAGGGDGLDLASAIRSLGGAPGARPGVVALLPRDAAAAVGAALSRRADAIHLAGNANGDRNPGAWRPDPRDFADALAEHLGGVGGPRAADRGGAAGPGAALRLAAALEALPPAPPVAPVDVVGGGAGAGPSASAAAPDPLGDHRPALELGARLAGLHPDPSLRAPTPDALDWLDQCTVCLRRLLGVRWRLVQRGFAAGQGGAATAVPEAALLDLVRSLWGAPGGAGGGGGGGGADAADDAGTRRLPCWTEGFGRLLATEEASGRASRGAGGGGAPLAAVLGVCLDRWQRGEAPRHPALHPRRRGGAVAPSLRGAALTAAVVAANAEAGRRSRPAAAPAAAVPRAGRVGFVDGDGDDGAASSGGRPEIGARRRQRQSTIEGMARERPSAGGYEVG